MKLYRCYDSRLNATERSLTLYGADLRPTRHRFETKHGSCNSILEILDEPPEQFSGTTILPLKKLIKSEARIEWLWRFCGHVKVISTEYHEGIHYAKRPEHLLPIVNHLEQLHENGYVHGDIRAYNMVMNYPERELCCRTKLLENLDGQIHVYNMILDYADCQKCDGWLIDFDFGGKIVIENGLGNNVGNKEHQNPKYPEGYYRRLPDGFRRGNEGEYITFDDDWYALGKVIMESHELEFSEIFKDPDVRNEKIPIYSYLRNELRDVFFGSTGSFSSLEGGPAKFLRDYLQLVAKNGFSLKPDAAFQLSLKEKYGENS